MTVSRIGPFVMPGVVFCVMALELASASAAGAERLADAQQLLYVARYEQAAATAASITAADDGEALSALEVQSTAILFQIRRLMEANKQGSASDTLKRCTDCRPLLDSFATVTSLGQERARAVLKGAPDDPDGLFFLGKLDLNYLWLQLGTLGRRTGWNEFWEAKKSLNRLLAQNPEHVRARVAVAWMEYIVDTKLPWGTEWILGGGDRKKALVEMRLAADTDSEFFVRAEAEFALWEMLVRERRRAEATAVAERLAARFPENAEVARFLKAASASVATR